MIPRLRRRVGIAAFITLWLTTWVVAAPDDPWQNSREISYGVNYDIPGRLTPRDKKPLADRVPVVWTHGWYANLTAANGLSPAEMEALFESAWIDVPIYFEEYSGREFERCFKDYEFGYNPNDSPRVNGHNLTLLTEADSELTRPNKRIYIGHSMGPLVIQAHRVETRGRKFGGLLAHGTPWHGTPAADEVTVRKGLATLAGGLPIDKFANYFLADLGLASEGARWLKPNCPERETMLRAMPLDQSCYLYAGAIVPIRRLLSIEGVLAFDQVLDGLYGTKDLAKLHQSYRFTAGILEAVGTGENDGVVPATSALAEGNNTGCNLRPGWEANHTQIITDAGLAVAIHRQMARDLWELYKQLRPDWREELKLTEDPAATVAQIEALANFQTLPYTAKVGWARLACADSSSGQLYVFDESRIESVGLGPSSCSWPSWDTQGRLLVNRRTVQGSCPVLIDTDGRVVMLTPRAELASIEASGQRWTYWKDDSVWIANLGDQMSARAIVTDKKLKLLAPPVICGEWIYLAQPIGMPANSYNIWRVRVSASRLSIADMGRGSGSEMLARAVPYRPRPFGMDVVGVAKRADDQLDFKVLNRSWYPSNFAFRGLQINDSLLVLVTDLAWDSRSDNYYLVGDGMVRRLPKDRVLEKYHLAEEMGHDSRWGYSDKVVVEISLEEFTPAVVKADQLAARP